MNRFQSFVCRLLRIPTPIKLQRRESWKIRLSEWQDAPQLVAESAMLAQNPTYRAQLDVLQTEHPCHWIFATTGTSANDRLIHQGKIEGYELCLNNMAEFVKQKKKKSKLEPTFADPLEQPK